MGENEKRPETCLRCGCELHTAEDFQTGICADCWDPDKDPDPGLPLDGNAPGNWWKENGWTP